MDMDKGMLSELFDLSFSNFITIKVIKFIYAVGIVLAALGALALVVAGLKAGFLSGLVSLLLAPVVFLVYVLLARIWCEFVIVVFRIAENTRRIADASESDSSPHGL